MIRFLKVIFSPCTYGLHRWSMPGGWCEDCSMCDKFFGGHIECGKKCVHYLKEKEDGTNDRL